MNRREVLAGAGSGLVASFSGCTRLRSNVATICSRPITNLDHLEFETRMPTALGGWSRWVSATMWEGGILATAPEHLDRFTADEFYEARDVSESDPEAFEVAAEDRTFFEGTDFERAFVLGIAVASSGASSPARITHVVRDGTAVHAYVCIRRKGTQADWAPQFRLARVHSDWVPEGVRVTFTDGGGFDTPETFESDGQGVRGLDR